MKSFFDKLNLRPHERRLVVVVGMMIFIVINIWFVWPYFDDWGQVKARMARSRDTLAKYQGEIARRAEYEAALVKLRETGSEMLTSEIELPTIVQNQAAAANVQITSSSTRLQQGGARTNQFFQEQTLSLNFNSGGEELVNFLVGIASGNAMVRVREMNIRPDPSQTRLTGTIVFVGNFQKASTNKTSIAATSRSRS